MGGNYGDESIDDNEELIVIDKADQVVIDVLFNYLQLQIIIYRDFKVHDAKVLAVLRVVLRVPEYLDQ